MDHRILNTTPDAVTFEVDAQSYKGGRFKMPAEVLRLLDMGDDEAVHLRIESLDGQSRWAGIHQMKSGAEIYGPELEQHVGPGERIRVVVSRP